MRQDRALLREAMLEKLFARKILEIRTVHPALEHALVQKTKNVLRDEKSDRDARLERRPRLIVVKSFRGWEKPQNESLKLFCRNHEK